METIVMKQKENFEFAFKRAKPAEPFYSREEVLAASLEYFNGDDLAAEVWMNKYSVKDKEGRYCELTPCDMHLRMAKEFARIEKKYGKNLNGTSSQLSNYGQKRKPLTEEKIFEYFDHFRHIIPQGSVMSVLGNPYVIGSLSNCIVIPEIYDSYGGVLFADQQLVQLMKRRCGVGIDISNLRPSGTPVSNAAGTATGAVSFMERFSNTTREVAQSGRRGALMITMDINHPEAEKFALIKQNLKRVTGANISLKLSDEFMQAVKHNKEYVQKWPINSPNPVIENKVKARELWNTIVTCAHNTAEPGLIFWDRQHHYSTSSVYPQYKNISTNPCSEIAMGNDSCRLIALNMFGCVQEPFSSNASFDFDKWYEICYEGQRLMDDLVDLELEYIERILEKVKNDSEPDYIKEVEVKTWEALYKSGKEGRRTGLGFTAMADTLAALGYKYDSAKALDTIEQIMKTKCEAEFTSSTDMAIERGAFVGFDPEIEKTSGYIQMMEKELPEAYQRMMQFGRRNVSLSTVAPTGSLSILTQTSSGIEPVFKVSYKRRRKINPDDKSARVDFVDALGDKWQEYHVFHPKFKLWMEVTGKTLPEDSSYYNSTAEEIDWSNRVKIQSIVQKYTTHSISSTINLPEKISTEKVGEIYMKAWEMGLKGITVYRAGSRSGVLISTEKKKDAVLSQENHVPKRPKILEADVIRFVNGGEKWIGFLGLLDGRPYEIFTGDEEDFPIPAYVEKGKIKKYKIITRSGKVNKYSFIFIDKNGEEVELERLSDAFNPEYWNYAKMISGVLRHKMPLPYVAELVSDLKLGDDSLNTWKAGVVRMLKHYIASGTKPKDKKCPHCGDEDGIVFEEGCLKCKSCGMSKC